MKSATNKSEIMNSYLSILFLSISMTLCYGGDITITYAPSSLMFVKASALRSSSVDDMLAVAMGYTPKTSPWTGLVVNTPFKSPAAAIVVGIDSSGADVPLEGHRYPLQEDLSLTKVFESLNSTVSATAQRPIHFLHLEVADGVSPTFVTLPTVVSLKKNKEPDASFLLEVGALPNMVDRLKVESSVSHDGQDFIFFQIESFSLLVKEYGDDSPQVREGKQLLSLAIEKLVAGARHLYKDEVLVVTMVTEKSALSLTRKTRQAKETGTGNLNLAAEYSTDFPAIFNIILFVSIILIVAVLAASAATGYMDPGRDSIIYRMTNPKMKKDQ